MIDRQLNQRQIDQRAAWRTPAIRAQRRRRSGLTGAVVLLAIAAIVAVVLSQLPDYAASPGGMLLLATITTAAGLTCRRLMP